MKTTLFDDNVARIKRRAKQLKRELGIQHHQALDRAAQEVGFQNWKNFLHSQQKAPVVSLRNWQPSGAIPRGTLVRLKDTRELGIVFTDPSHQNLVSFYSEWGPGYALRTELSVCRDQMLAADFIPRRLYLPYGKWTCENGAQVLFNRDYTPIWVMHTNGVVRSIDPDTWILHSRDKEEWFFQGRPSKAEFLTGRSILREWGVEDQRSLVVQQFPEAIRTGNIKMLAPKIFKKRFPS